MNSELGPTILVVDDDELVRTFIAHILQRAGYAVLLANDGVDGVAVFRRGQDSIAAVILDLTMPNMDGERALQAIRGLREDIPAILMSGIGSDALPERFLAHWRTAFIQKPFRAKELVLLLREVMKSEE